MNRSQQVFCFACFGLRRHGYDIMWLGEHRGYAVWAILGETSWFMLDNGGRRR